MQSEFRPLVKDAVLYCEKYFDEKLLTIYLHGSIAKGDAIPYVSDLDFYIVISCKLKHKDKKYIEIMEQRLQQKYPIINGIHFSVHSLGDLENDKFARFILKYNSMLYFGKDIVKELDDIVGCEKFEPNVKLAKSRLDFARECFKQALDDKQPMCVDEVPNDTYYAARKYARYFVVIEGAYFLMSQNKFESFEKMDVLDKLYKYTNGFEKELDMTRQILIDSKRTGISHYEFLKRIRSFVEWMFDMIEKT